MLKFRFSPQDLGMRYKLLECATHVYWHHFTVCHICITIMCASSVNKALISYRMPGYEARQNSTYGFM